MSKPPPRIVARDQTLSINHYDVTLPVIVLSSDRYLATYLPNYLPTYGQLVARGYISTGT